jgi:hypothetical protein
MSCDYAATSSTGIFLLLRYADCCHFDASLPQEKSLQEENKVLQKEVGIAA